MQARDAWWTGCQGIQRWRGTVSWGLLAIILLVGLEGGEAAPPQRVSSPIHALSVPVPAATPGSLRVHTGHVRRGQTAFTLLRQVGLKASTILKLQRVIRPVYDLRRLRVGHPYRIEMLANGVLWRLVYEIDAQYRLEVRRQGGRFVGYIQPIPYRTRQRVLSGTIYGSVHATLVAQGEDPRLATDLADIFAWDVDFHTDVRDGDSFRLLIEERARQGRAYRYHRILAARLVNKRRVLEAVYYPPHGTKGAYYRPDGHPMRRMFLRSPLRYRRISSRFTYRRFHPILKRYRPHLGIDYAAPVGTPVHSVADGVVVWAGRKGASGKMVKVRHSKAYVTYYLHLSRFARGIHVGTRVRQGQVIGYVGATGLATGPHLCFRLTKRGKFLNPVRLTNVQAPPLPRKILPAYRAYAARVLAKLRTEPAVNRLEVARTP